MHSVSHPVRRLATVLTSIGLAALVATGTVLAGTPVTAGWRDHGYAGGAFRPASDKPESKLWYTQEAPGVVQWWGGMFRFSTSPPLSEFRIYKLSSDKSTWSPTTTIVDRRDNTHGDYLWDETANTLYVASVGMPNTTSPFAVPATPDDVRIFRYTYSAASDTYTQIGGSLSYRAIAGTGSTASPAFRGGAWSVSIDKDSTGRLWVVLTQAHEVRFSTSTDNGETWTPIAQLPTQGSNTINVGTMSDTDIASVIAFGNGSKNTVGVMWSDQDNLPAATNNGYYFSTIAAGDDPTVGANWSTDKLPNGGLGNIYADNHINMKATSDGTLYMVGKANTDTVNCATLKTRLLTPLYRRTAGGVWDAPRLVGTAGDCETRPQLAISEELNTIYVFLTAPNGGGVIYRKSAPLTGPNAFDFRGPADELVKRGVTFIKSSTETLIDDASTTKQEVTSASGIAVIANNLLNKAGTNLKFYLHNYMDLPASDSIAPSGSVAINGGAPTTSNQNVVMSVPATDTGGSGLSLVRISNDSSVDGNGRLNGADATSYTYTNPIAWTMTAGLGTKTVYVQWRDAAGNWSVVSSDDILVTTDATPPNPTASVNHLLFGSGRFGIPVRLAWPAATDNVGGSGVKGYQVTKSVNGAPLQVVTPLVAATGISLDLPNSAITYKFCVATVDNADNLSARRCSATFKTVSVSESSAAMHFTGTWALSNSAVYVGGKA
ncbi:MAG TPA: hypothetical protein VFN41_15335, partial [Candidatus Limnocylindrales bacterium]|nr:hypothetical protein [Candidatus Limnocylindrales bacterium]